MKAVFIEFNLMHDENYREAVWMLKKTGFAIIELNNPTTHDILTADRNIELNRSWLITNTLDGVEAGVRAGCQTLLIADGAEKDWQVSMSRQPDLLSPDIENAAGAVILRSIYDKLRSEWPQNFGQNASTHPGRS